MSFHSYGIGHLRPVEEHILASCATVRRLTGEEHEVCTYVCNAYRIHSFLSRHSIRALVVNLGLDQGLVEGSSVCSLFTTCLLPT